MKRIAIILSEITIGGNNTSAINIAQALSEKYCVYLFVFNSKGVTDCEGIPVVNIGIKPTSNRVKQVINSFKRIVAVKKLIKELDISLIYLFLGVDNLLNYIHYGKVKKIVSCRDCGGLITKLKRYEQMLKTSDCMIFNSKYMEEYFHQNSNIRKKTFTLYNIVSVKNKTEDDILPEEEIMFHSKRCIISVGRFCKEKGFCNLIKSFEILKNEISGISDVDLVIIGDGILKNQVEQLIQQSKYKSSIHLLGYKKNPSSYVALAEFYVLSSFSEGFPNVLIESMAVGTPVISTNCKSGPKEILSSDSNYADLDSIDYEEFGVLVPTFKSETYKINDIDQEHHILSDAMLAMLSSKTLRDRYSKAAQERARAFSIEATKEKMNEIFEEILKS